MASNFQKFISHNDDSESSNLGASILTGGAISGAYRLCFRSKIKVLIVDDDKVCRMVMKAHLRHFGIMDSKEAGDGQEAVNMFLAGENFDIVFMDCHMPAMNGPEATRKLRSMGVAAKIVGVTLQENHKEFCNSGVDDMFEKPVNEDKLFALLQEVAGNS